MGAIPSGPARHHAPARPVQHRLAEPARLRVGWRGKHGSLLLPWPITSGMTFRGWLPSCGASCRGCGLPRIWPPSDPCAVRACRQGRLRRAESAQRVDARCRRTRRVVADAWLGEHGAWETEDAEQAGEHGVQVQQLRRAPSLRHQLSVQPPISFGAACHRRDVDAVRWTPHREYAISGRTAAHASLSGAVGICNRPVSRTLQS